jgi:hypothetical protein
MKEDNLEELKQIANTIENLTYALQLGMPPAFHVERLKVALPEIKNRIDKITQDEEV